MGSGTRRIVVALPVVCALSGTRAAAGGGTRHVALAQRLGRRRLSYALGRGASASSEASVAEALRWLAGSREADGRWKGTKSCSDEATTAYAVLAFLGAGQTEEDGEHADTVSEAVGWIIGRQKRSGFVGGAGAGVTHDHAACALALVEAWGMGRVPATNQASTKALEFTVALFERTGHRAATVPDPVTTALSVMTGKSALISGLTVNPVLFSRALSYFDWHAGGRRRVVAVDQRCAAAATAFALMLVGFKSDDARIVGTADSLMRHPPEAQFGRGPVDWEHLQFASLVMFHLGGHYKSKWLGALRDLLVERQRVGPGELAGSWDFSPGDDSRDGRAFATAMGALCLESYYRYLPIY